MTIERLNVVNNFNPEEFSGTWADLNKVLNKGKDGRYTVLYEHPHKEMLSARQSIRFLPISLIIGLIFVCGAYCAFSVTAQNSIPFLGLPPASNALRITYCVLGVLSSAGALLFLSCTVAASYEVYEFHFKKLSKKDLLKIKNNLEARLQNEYVESLNIVNHPKLKKFSAYRARKDYRMAKQDNDPKFLADVVSFLKEHTPKFD